MPEASWDERHFASFLSTSQTQFSESISDDVIYDVIRMGINKLTLDTIGNLLKVMFIKILMKSSRIEFIAWF